MENPDGGPNWRTKIENQDGEPNMAPNTIFFITLLLWLNT